MSYELLILRRAQKELAKLPLSDFERMKVALLELTENPRPTGCKKLVGREGWRIRAGNYRAIYEIDDDNNTITILDVGNRKNIY
jgi:mRNA interferase RelE/StbE